MFRNIWRRLDAINGLPGETRSIELPRKDLLREILLRVSVTVNITTLGAPVLRAHAPAPWIRRIELIADGRDVLKSINYKGLVLKNFFNSGVYPRRSVPTLVTGNNTLTQTCILSINLPRALVEVDTLLNTGKLSTFSLQITFGANADGFATTPTAYSVTAIQVVPHIHEAININVPEEKLNFSVYKENFLEREVTQTTPELQMLLPVGNVYRGMMVEAEIAGEPADNVINEVIIRSGTTVYYRGSWLSIREMNAIKHCMETLSYTGYAYLDFCPEGRLSDALDASKLSMLEAVFDVTKQSGVNFVRIYPDEIVIPSLPRR